MPLTYAGDVYGLSSRAQSCNSCSAISATIWRCSRRPLRWPRWRWHGGRGGGAPRAHRRARAWSRGANPSVNASQALNIWIIQIVVAIGPPLGGLVFKVYMKTDWGISLFFLTPLALVAIPALRIQRIALFHITAIWLVVTLAALAASPRSRSRKWPTIPMARRATARAPNLPAN